MVVTLHNDILDVYFLCNFSSYFLYHILVLKKQRWIKPDHYVICFNQVLFFNSTGFFHASRSSLFPYVCCYLVRLRDL